MSQRADLVATVLAAALWTMAVASLAIWRHNAFLSHKYDLGNMVQAVWSTANGRLLEVTSEATGEQVSRLAGHVDPILLLLAPFWLLKPAPETLIVVQSAALAAGLYPVVQLAKKYVHSGYAVVLLGAWYLIHPWVVWSAVNDVHPVTFAIPLLLYAIWALDEERLRLFAVFAFLAVLCGELVGITVAALGLWYAIRSRRVRVGLSIAVASTAWSVLAVLVVVPAANDGKPSPFYGRFESVGGSPSGLLETVVTEPRTVIDAVSTGADLGYALLLLAPTAFLAFGAPVLAACAAPQLLLNMMSDFWSTTQPMFQYVAPALAPLVAATVFGVARLPNSMRTVGAIAPFAVALACLAAFPPEPGTQSYVFGPSETQERVEAMRTAVDLVPDDASVMTTNRIGAHLADRRQIHAFPSRARASWAVVDTRDPWLFVSGETVDRRRFSSLLAKFDSDPEWERVYDRQGVRVYSRTSG